MSTGRAFRLDRILTAAVLTLCQSGTALAADGGGGWRATYDAVLLWVNFAIFLFIIVKYARIPLRNFLKGRQEGIESKIKRMDAEKASAQNKIKEMLAAVAENDRRLAELKENLIAEGENKRQAIIADAKLEARLMIEATQHKIDGHLQQARHQIKSEMLDAAIELARERLPEFITPDDNHKRIQHYLKSALPDSQ